MTLNGCTLSFKLPQLLTARTPVRTACTAGLQGHEEIVWAVEVCGRRLFSASADKTIRVWDIESRRCEQVMEDHTRPVLSLSIANGKLFSGSYDYTIKVRALGLGADTRRHAPLQPSQHSSSGGFSTNARCAGRSAAHLGLVSAQRPTQPCPATRERTALCTIPATRW